MMLKIKLIIAKLIQTVIGILVGAAVAYITASIFHSIFVLVALEGVGAEISLGIWLKTIMYNIVGLAFYGAGFSYAGLIVIGFLIAMPSAVLTRKIVKVSPWLVYVSAGATAIVTILYVGSLQFFGYSLIASAQGAAGFGCQMCAGALGGAVFYSIYKRGGLSV